MKNREVYNTQKLEFVYEPDSPKAFIYYYPSHNLMALVGIINISKGKESQQLIHWLEKEYSLDDLYVLYNLD